MAVTAILYFVKILYLTNFFEKVTDENFHQIWWQSVERFESYSTLSICRYLGFRKNILFDQFAEKLITVTDATFLFFKYGDNRLNGSEL